MFIKKETEQTYGKGNFSQKNRGKTFKITGELLERVCFGNFTGEICWFERNTKIFDRNEL